MKRIEMIVIMSVQERLKSNYVKVPCDGIQYEYQIANRCFIFLLN